jgi:hypothetical protein
MRNEKRRGDNQQEEIPMLNETGACHSFTPLPVRNYSTMGEW